MWQKLDTQSVYRDVGDLKEIYDKTNNANPYLTSGDLIEDKYYQFKGQ